MASTSSIVIIAVIVGIIVLGGLWARSRGRVTGDVPPAKIEDKPVARAEPLATPPLPPPPKPVAKTAPEPVVKAVPAPRPAAAKATPKPKAPAAKKPAVRKAAAPAKAPKASAPAAPAPFTAIGVPAAVGAPDNLLLVKGIGPKLNTLLTGLGIARFDQIAAWGAEDAAKVDAHLGAFKGRIERDSWIEQAGLLAKGAIADFEAKFGKLDSENQ